MVELRQQKIGSERTTRSRNKENLASHGATPSTSGIEAEQSKCSVCSGLYDDDIVGGVLVKDWMSCTNESYHLWMHSDCLTMEGDSLYVLCVMYCLIDMPLGRFMNFFLLFFFVINIF